MNSKMREDVVIVLNEREPLKQQLATELSTLLSERNTSNSRLKPTPNIAQIIRERRPKVLVLDYILGDHGTALDILSDLQEPELKRLIQTVVWTDEPSAGVAVSAMKLGAADYIETALPNSLERVLESIERITRDADEDGETSDSKSVLPTYENPVGEDRSFQESLNYCYSLATRNSPIVVITGETGTGRNTVGRYIHFSRHQPGSLIELSCDTFSDSVETICGGGTYRGLPKLTHKATVIIDHLEFDPGELLDALCARRNVIWAGDPTEAPMLIIGTTSAETARSWARLAQAEVVELPALEKRQEDFLPLIQRFTTEAQAFGKINRWKISTQLLSEIRSLGWPGNVRQFRAAILEALTVPPESITEGGYFDRQDKPEHEGRQLSRAERLIIRAVLAAKLRWERYHTVSTTTPQPIAARFAVDSALGNIRIAAAMLGTGVPQIMSALHPTDKIATNKPTAQ